jgi:hypothetical protein
MFVSRGRTLVIDGQANGPGAMVKLPTDEAARLQSAGFVQSEPPRLDPTVVPPNPAAIGHVSPGINAGTIGRAG